jgi:BirA family biotin operon repressor/biotin-[acetyl-CoA-carboxylase] ligase
MLGVMGAEKFNAEEIGKGLETAVIGRKIVYYESLASTMDEARRLARGGAPEGTVIIAEKQTGGRGRLRRTWLAPEGNIAMSVVLRPRAEDLPFLIMITSLAVARAIEAVTGMKPGIKWPNDVLLNGKKVCGILIENEVRGKEVLFTVIGTGINVALRVEEHPDISGTATGLSEAAGREVSRVEVAKGVLQEMDRLYRLLPDGGHIFKEWKKRLETLGRRVTATSGTEVIEGMAEDVDGTGALLLRRDDGSLATVVVGDVTLKTGSK